jgi:D-glycero-alpha-D-manno-heptose 1-phosphate guanylyltransferase
LNHEPKRESTKSEVSKMTVLLLVGGMGTRLQTVVQSTPKPLASIGDKAFLELLVRQLTVQGFRRLIMCTGYLAEKIEGQFGNGHDLGIEIEYSTEPHPLGTAGAVKRAYRFLGGDENFVVMNGDSFMQIDFSKLVRFHGEHRGLVSMGVFKTEDSSRYGTVQVNTDGRVTGFSEKDGIGVPGLVNGGVYVFARAVMEHIPEGTSSLERDVFPVLLGEGVYALEQHGMFIDIGTPEDYARAQTLRDRLYEAAGSSMAERLQSHQ